MAEYLDPRDGYALVTFPDWQAPQPWWIEVPDGAETLTKNGDPYLIFWKEGFKKSVFNDCDWVSVPYGADDYIRQWREERASIIWQRPTQPEELPFIDDGYNPFGYGDGADDTQDHYNSGQPPAHFVVRPKPRERVYAELGKWSPDWSQAPEWADAWRTTECGQAWWSRGDWFVRGDGWHATGSYPKSTKAPSFGFTGDWKQSECRRYLQHVMLEQTVSA